MLGEDLCCGVAIEIRDLERGVSISPWYGVRTLSPDPACPFGNS